MRAPIGATPATRPLLNGTSSLFFFSVLSLQSCSTTGGMMGRECEVSGKKTSFGNHITRRGKAKYLGGVGKKTTGGSRRTVTPTRQRIHVGLPNGTTRYVRVATSVIRTGMLTLEVDGKMQTFPLIKASKGSAQAREELKQFFPI